MVLWSGCQFIIAAKSLKIVADDISNSLNISNATVSIHLRFSEVAVALSFLGASSISFLSWSSSSTKATCETRLFKLTP